MEKVQTLLPHLTLRPGVYQFFDAQQHILYVGKANQLKKRVSSYFTNKQAGAKTQALVAKIVFLQVIVTHTETEALLLEQTLIKTLTPPYNILLRDDKSYPYIYLSSQQTYPRLSFHRGAKPEAGELFGPYPSGLAVRQSLQLLQKVFKVRQCEDSFFSHRTRPCLNYQIKRCSGPCVQLISESAYQESVEHTRLFLKGQSFSLIQKLADKMEQAAKQQAYETAADYRDQIVALRRIQESQHVTGKTSESLDVIAIEIHSTIFCIHLLKIRDSRVLGGKNYLIRHHASTEEVLNEFIGQYYLGTAQQEIPAGIILQFTIPDADLLTQVLTERAQHRVQLQHKVRGTKAAWQKLAQTNAQNHLISHLATKENLYQRFLALQNYFQLSELPQRLECFDISHTQGQATYAACVVFDINGPVKEQYRRYKIADITPGDDYAAMEQALMRRYTQSSQTEIDSIWPDIIFVDGGKGQLNRAKALLHELQLDHILLIGISKGPDRKPGLEKIWSAHHTQPTQLPPTHAALHLIQAIRDEAHRFAITGHRNKRQQLVRHSPLENIPGIGAKRRRTLLTHFGGLQELKRASIEDMAKCPGISAKIAKMIYAEFHDQ